MFLLLRILTAASLVFAATPPADLIPFNRAETPIGNTDFILLIEKGYRFDEEGLLISPDTQAPVLKEDYYYLIEDLRSSTRLKALMEINLILSRNNYSGSLPFEDEKKIQEIGRRNWSLLSKRTRTQIAPHFAASEVFELNTALSKTSAPIPTNDVRIVSAASIPDAVPVPVNAPLKTLAGPLMPLSRPMGETLIQSNSTEDSHKPKAPPSESLPKTDAPEALDPLPSETELGFEIDIPSEVKTTIVPAETIPADFPVEKEGPMPAVAPADSPAPIVTASADIPIEPPIPAPPAAPTPRPSFQAAVPAPPPIRVAYTGTPLSQNILKPSVIIPPAPKAPIPAVPVAVSRPTPHAVKQPALNALPEYPAFDTHKFSLFLKATQYENEVKELLQSIAQYAHEKDREIALGTLMLRLPKISISARSSDAYPYALIPRSDTETPAQIELQAGPHILSHRKLIGGRKSYALAHQSTLYESGIPTEVENAPLATLSKEERAGHLLHALMTLDGDTRGWARHSHLNRVRALKAEFRYYGALRRDRGVEPALSSLRAALYEEWRMRPSDFLDFLAQAPAYRLSAGIKTLHDAGILPASQAERLESRLDPWTEPNIPPKKFQYFNLPGAGFTADIPAGWSSFIEKSPGKTAVHILGSPEARGAWRAAYHIRIIEKGEGAFKDIADYMKSSREKSTLTHRGVDRMRSMRVSRKAARIFEVRESRRLPFGGLPAGTIRLHHYYALVPLGKDAYATIKLSTTEETFLDYRKEFLRFLKNIRIVGY